MSLDLGWAMDDSSRLLATGLGLATRATVLLAVALLVWRIVGRRRPVVGSAIGQGAVVGLLLLPASAWLVPAWSIPIPRAFEPTPPAEVRPVAVEPPSPLPPFEDKAELADLAREVFPALPEPVVAPVLSRVALVEEPAPPRPRLDFASVVLAAYASVALAMLARLGGSLVGVARVRQGSGPVEDPTWVATLDRLRGELGIERPVALARSSRVGVPAVIGWRRPMILLPATALASPEHAEAILLHELAHVRRGDYGWNLGLRVVNALYWPHPLAWVLARAVADSRERACDAFCVHRMGGSSAYRSALLAVAEALARRPGPALGLAMAGRSRLSRRVAEIDQGRAEPRCRPRAAARLAMLALALGSAALIGPARFTWAEPEPRPVVAPTPPPVLPVQAPKPPASGKVFRLRIVAAATGQPVPRADVRVWIARPNDGWRVTDDQGRLDITYDTSAADRGFALDAWGDGFAMQRHNWGSNLNVPVPDEATIRLQPGESLGGTVQDQEGWPIPGATVYLWSHNYKHQDPKELLYDLRAVTGPDGRWHTGGAPTTTGKLLGFYITHPDFLSDRQYAAQRVIPSIEDLRAGKAVSVMVKGAPIEGRVLGPDGRPVEGAEVLTTQSPWVLDYARALASRTDADGRFRTGQVAPGDWHLVVLAKQAAPFARVIKVGSAIPFEEIRLTPPKTFRARVVDPDGRPVEGAFIPIDRWGDYRFLGISFYSDAEGRVRWEEAPEGDLRIDVMHQGYERISRRIDRVTDEELTITLDPALEIAGTVRDATTRLRIERARVEYGDVVPATGEVAQWNTGLGGRSQVSNGSLNAEIPVFDADFYKLRISADGYEPFVSRAFRREERAVLNYDVTLVPLRGSGRSATAIRPDGRPLVGAGRRESLGLRDGQVGARYVYLGETRTTDAEGKFAITGEEPPSLVLVVGDDCFAYANSKALTESPRLQARPYGRVEGRFLVGGRPRANWPMELSGTLQDESTSFIVFDSSQTTRTDAEGRFAFEKVIAMPGLRVARHDPPEAANLVRTIGEPIRVEDGKTSVVIIGGRGRTVVGRITAPPAWDQPIDFTDLSRVSISSDRPIEPIPLDLFRDQTDLNKAKNWDWTRAWRKTPEGQAHLDARVVISTTLAPDGSFRIDDVPPGEYRVQVSVNEDRVSNRRSFAPLGTTLTIPPIPGGRSDQPIDLGRLGLRARRRIEVGEPAPAIEVTTVDGRKLAIPGDFAGKTLLLDLGSTWESQARYQVVRLNDVFARFGQDPQFAIVILLLDRDGPESRAFVADKGQPWSQAIVGPSSNPITEAYDFDADQSDVPAAILIGPDGRVVAKDLYHGKIGEAVAGSLGLPVPAAKP